MSKTNRAPVPYDTLEDNESVYRARQKGLLVRETARAYALIDLFAGAGGLTLGFTQSFGHVFIPVWANDFNAYAAKTYNANFGEHCTTDDILDVVENRIDDIPKADVVIGGPPCQGFSLLNKQRDGDPRKQLWRPYLRIVEHSGAEIFVMENVPQLLGSAEHEEIAEVAHSLGFKMAFAKLCAADYGVPQTRWRAFIIGCKFTHPSAFFPPKKTHRRPGDFRIDSPRVEIQRQIGNAVPSLLAEVLGRALREQVCGERMSEPLRLAVRRSGTPPPPEPTQDVSREYLSLVGNHAAHPGTGKGRSYQAAAQQQHAADGAARRR